MWPGVWCAEHSPNLAWQLWLRAKSGAAQVAEEVFLLSRVVRSFGTEERESGRYRACLGMLRRISIRQAAAYLLYLVTNASLFNLTKARA